MSPSSRSVRRAVTTAVVTVATGLALSGCGVGSTRVAPGAAAEVGDATIGLSDVNDAAGDLCEMFDVLTEQGAAQPVPGALIRKDTVRSLVLREVADQLADEYDAGAGDSYGPTVDDLTAQLLGIGVDADLVDRVVPELAAIAYYGDVVTQIGRDSAGLAAADDTQGAGLQEGLTVAADWAADHPIEVNPRFGSIELLADPQLLRMTTDDLSLAVSDFAVSAQAATDIDEAGPESGAELAADLPASQRCG